MKFGIILNWSRCRSAAAEVTLLHRRQPSDRAS